MDLQTIKSEIKKIIVEKLELNIKPEEIEDSEILFGGGLGLNSISSITLIVEIEIYFKIEISDDDLTLDLFDSVEKLAQYVSDKINK
jgi:acyl carrier protein